MVNLVTEWWNEVLPLASKEGQWLMSQLPELHCIVLEMWLAIFSFYLYLSEKAFLVGGTVKASRDSLSVFALWIHVMKESISAPQKLLQPVTHNQLP